MGWKFADMTKSGAVWARPVDGKKKTVRQADGRGTHRNEASPSTSSVIAGFDFRDGLPAGFIPTAVIQGDFNEDGNEDLAISNGGDNSVFILFGNGDGSFNVPELLYTRGQSPDWITAVRMRSGGHLDLVVVNGDSKSLEIFQGNGDGTFQPGAQSAIPQIPTFVVPADVNKDGKPDLVVGLVIDTNATQPQFEVFLGNGAGGFSGHFFPPAIYGNPDGPVPTGWVAIGDLNNDDSVDVVTTVTGGISIPYLNVAGHAFSLEQGFAAEGGNMVAELGDVDEDGCTDMVELSVFGYLAIGKGTCDGGFVQGPNLQELGDLEPAAKLADIDGDGHLDVVGSAAFYNVGGLGYGTEGGYLVSTLKGDGKGNFGAAKVYRGGTDAFSIVLADFNGDGKPEIVTADSLEGRASILVNDGTANFGSPQGETIGYLDGAINAPYPSGPVVTADLNGDGKPDILLVEIGAFSGDAPKLAAVLNDGTGKLLPVQRTDVEGGDLLPPILAVGPFRTPSRGDVVYINTYNGFNIPHLVLFFPGNGDGTFGSSVTLTDLPDPQRVVTGDFNKDGKLDFAVYGSDGRGKNDQLDVFLGHGDGTFTHLAAEEFPFRSALITPQQLIAGDFDHDGTLDLLICLNGNGGWEDSGDDLLLATGNVDGTFQTPRLLMAHFGAVAVGDLNHDGRLDLVQKRDPDEDVGSQVTFTPAVTVYLGQADGSFVRQPTYFFAGEVLPSFDPVLLGDFNGDGNLDIGYRYFTGQFYIFIEGLLQILQGNGDGTFSVGHAYQLQGFSAPFVGADFNGDHTDDLVELVGFTSSLHTIQGHAGPSLDITLDSNPVLGSTGSATVTLNLPAVSATVVTLSTSQPAVHVPASLHFPPGEQSATFAFTLDAGFDATHVIGLYATLGTETAVAYGYKPNANLTVGASASLFYGFDPLFQDFFAITPGENFRLLLDLLSEGGYSGTFSSYQCSGLPAGAACSFDDTAIHLFPGGPGQVGFTVSSTSSTPMGEFPVQVSATDGFVTASVMLTLGIGDFSLSAHPTTIVAGLNGQASTTVTSVATNGLNEFIALSCPGLPSSATCELGGSFTTNGSVGLGVITRGASAGDYPFQIVGQANLVSHTTNATLRVGDFSASLDKTTVTLTPGQSADFVLTLTSINHYANDFSVFCQSPSAKVTCTPSNTRASLSDSGTATVSLTVAAVANSAVARSSPYRDWLFLVVALFCLPLVGANPKTRRSRVLLVFFTLALLPSCGGGSSGVGGSGGGGNPPPEIVSIPVIALGDFRIYDSSNQKITGPIVVTLH